MQVEVMFNRHLAGELRGSTDDEMDVVDAAIERAVLTAYPNADVVICNGTTAADHAVEVRVDGLLFRSVEELFLTVALAARMGKVQA